LVSICLPDETLGISLSTGVADPFQLSLCDPDPTEAARRSSTPRVRRLVSPRDDLRPAYLNTQGMRVGKSGGVLQVREKDALKQEIRIGEISQLNLMGNVQVSTQSIQTLCEAEVPVCYFSQGDWFYGITGMNLKNVFFRKSQFRFAEQEWFALSLAKRLVAGKIRNQRTMLQRNHLEPSTLALQQMKAMAERAEVAYTWMNCLASRATQPGCTSANLRV
jgi:CRISP-associated protein Cas1